MVAIAGQSNVGRCRRFAIVPPSRVNQRTKQKEAALSRLFFVFGSDA
jgi:hypothetical protein